MSEALKMVEQEGPEGVSLRAVARAAGVSQAAPYHHFKDKQALLSAVAARGFRTFRMTMLARADGIESAEQRLAGLGLRRRVVYRARHGCPGERWPARGISGYR